MKHDLNDTPWGIDRTRFFERNEDDYYPAPIGKPAIKHSLPCCALCNITMGNSTTIAEIQRHLNLLRKEVNMWCAMGGADGGQTATFTIVSPGEYVLEANLIKLGYREVASFERRTGYTPEGRNKMYFLEIEKDKNLINQLK